MSTSTEDRIRHYQRSIERSLQDKDRLLYCIKQLSSLPVTVSHLEVTGVGRTVNSLRKIEDGVGDGARSLVSKWKNMVSSARSSNDEDEACVPDAPESYETPDYDSEQENGVTEESSYNHNESEISRRSSVATSLEISNEINSYVNEMNEDYQEELREKSKNRSSSSKHTSKHSSNKEKSLKKDSETKPHSHYKGKYNKYEASKVSNDPDKYEPMCYPSSSSSTSTDKRYSKDKKRKYESNSDGDDDDDDDGGNRKKMRNSSSEDEEEEENEKDNLVIYDEESEEEKEIKEEVKEEEEDEEDVNEEDNDEEQEDEKDYKEKKKSDEQSRKKSSLKGTSHCDTSKSKEKHHSSSHSKTKSRESNDKSSKDKKHSSSKSSEREKDEKRKDDKHHSKESSKSKSSVSSSNGKDKEKDKSKSKSKHSKDKDQKSEKEQSCDKVIKDEKNKYKDNKESKEQKESKESKKSKENKDSKEQKDRHKSKDHKKQKSKEKKESKKDKKNSEDEGGIDGNSGTSFAEALGMCMMPPPSKKKKENISSSLSKSMKSEPTSFDSPTSSTSSKIKSSTPKVRSDPPDSPDALPLLSSNVKLEPLSRINEDVDLASTLPEPSPHYRPLPQVNHIQRKLEEDQMLSEVIYAKNQRTKVYSGNKTGYTSVPSLYEMCIRLLIENIEALEYTGGVPYYIIRPVLERASADQLFMLEQHNPYLIEETDELWKFHCSKDFRTKKREEMESFREMYLRCLDEREAKLKALTANIKQSIDKSTPVRSTKLAYVDHIVKPPRNVLRQQAKYGTANATTKSSDLKKKLIAAASGPSGSSASAERISVPPPPPARVRQGAPVLKKTKAPLMAKALQAIKGRYKR